MWHVEYRCAARNQKAETSDSRHPAEIPFQRIRITHGPVAVNIQGDITLPGGKFRQIIDHIGRTVQRIDLRKRQFACRCRTGRCRHSPVSDRPRNSRPKPPSGGKPPCSREAGSTTPPDDRACPPTTMRHPHRPGNRAQTPPYASVRTAFMSGERCTPIRASHSAGTASPTTASGTKTVSAVSAKSRTLSYVSIPLFSANASNAAVICSRRLPPGAKYASIETVPAPSPSEA